MNRLLLSVLLVLSTCGLFAQVAPSTPNSIADSSMAKPVEVKPVDVQTGMSESDNIADNLARSNVYVSYYKLLQAAGLAETFRSRGPITLFLPDDSAFAKLSKGAADSLLMPANLPRLIALLTYHAIPGKLTAGKIARQIDGKTGLATFTTLSGAKLNVKFDDAHNLILIDDTGHKSTITKFDLKQSNGMIHVIDTVLSPKNRLI